MGAEKARSVGDDSALLCLVELAQRHGIHLTVDQIVRENALDGSGVSFEVLTHYADNAGLKSKALRLSWSGLVRLSASLPAIVELKTGGFVMLIAVSSAEERPGVVVKSPSAQDVEAVHLDRIRFEENWTGRIFVARRNYHVDDAEQPFSLAFVAGLVLRERRILRDIAVCAVLLSLFALFPIMFMRSMSDRVLAYGAMSTFTALCLFGVVFLIFDTLFGFLRSYLLLIVSARVDIRLSEYVFDKVLKLPISYFETRQVGTISHDFNESYRIRSFLTGRLFSTVLDSFTLFIFIPVMFAFSPLLTFVVLGVTGLMAIVLILILPIYRKHNQAVIEARAQRGSFLIQTLQGMRTVKALALESRQRRMWDAQVARLAKLEQKEGLISAVVAAIVRPLELLAMYGTFALGVYLAIVSKDPVYVGAMFAFLLLTQRVVAPLISMAQLINQYDEARAAVGMVSRLANQTKEDGHAGVRSPLKGEVEFANVRFAYPGSLTPAIDDLSFTLPKGGTLGVVGRSGCGKTTMTRLLQRLHSEYEGQIKIDGVDVREFNVGHLRHNLGVVLQDNFLFSGTIRDNICAAKTNATIDEIVRAARLAGAEEFIDRLPRGYDTHIYEGSPNLSGGQRQRLAIARALIVDPRILILDEATSALDPESEEIVNANIRKIAKGRTVIIISHRLSSIADADSILVMDRGKKVDIGSHQELLERCEIYDGLWHRQNPHLSAPRLSVVRGSSRV